jgi:hypothetical protein
MKNVSEDLQNLATQLSNAEALVIATKRSITEYFMPVIKILDTSYVKAGAEVVLFDADERFDNIRVTTSWNNNAGSFHETVTIKRSILEAADPEQAARDFVEGVEAFKKSLVLPRLREQRDELDARIREAGGE